MAKIITLKVVQKIKTIEEAVEVRAAADLDPLILIVEKRIIINHQRR